MKKGEVRLSQCMIVKNEEKNIRRALEWAKNIAFEQIVVDTGSTDDTVKIAEEMGARVYHFEWIDDFSAAKNYAIDQATGNWIAFLDADEYYTRQDAEKLIDILGKIERTMERQRKPHIIRSKWVQLDDRGIPFGVTVQDRIFRKLSDLRYQNRIHEQIALKSGRPCRMLDCQEELSIFHTGYSQNAYARTNKVERNKELLLEEVKSNPNNYNAWCYLGDCYNVLRDDEEAEECFLKVLDQNPGSKGLSVERFNNAGIQLLRMYAKRKQISDEVKLFQVAEKLGYPHVDDPDLYYYLGTWLFYVEQWTKAKSVLEDALEKLEHYRGTGMVMIAGNLENVYIWLAAASQKLEQPQDVVRYGVLALRMNRYLTSVLGEILALLKKEPGEMGDCDGTWRFLTKLYDMSNLKDQLFILKCAKAVGFISLEERIYESLPEEEKQQIRLTKQEKEMDDLEENRFGIPIRNRVDRRFVEWVLEIDSHTTEEITRDICDNIKKLEENASSTYRLYVQYYQKYSFWGKLDPEHEIWEAVEQRARSMKEHLDDLVWLYGRLEDYRSREVLLAILRNWTYLDVRMLDNMKERHPDYYDLDLIPSGEEEVFVDVGAYIGDSINNFVDTYGKNYDKIFAYEITEDVISVLERNTESLHDVNIRQKGIGKENSVMYVADNKESNSANTLKKSGDDGKEITIVSLDEDIKEPVTWIKMDIEGAEYDALLGCKRHIREEKPKLSVCTYHGYDDIWRLPRLIHEMESSYRFYMRYYGGNLIPTEYVLIALSKE